MNLHQLHRREENQDEYRSQYLSWIKTRSSRLEFSNSKIIESAHKSSITWLDLDHIEHRYLLSCAANGTISAYDTIAPSPPLHPTGRCTQHKPIFTLSKLHPDIQKSVSCIAWYTVDNGMFASAGRDGLLKIWDANTLYVSSTFTLNDKLCTLSMSSIASSHCLIAVGSNGADVQLCDILTGGCTHRLSGHRGPVWAVQWSASKEWELLTGGSDGQLRLWDIRRAGAVAVFDMHHTATLSMNAGVRYGSLGTTTVSPTSISTLGNADARNNLNSSSSGRGKKPAALSLAHDGAITAILSTPDGDRWLSAGTDDRLRLWDAATHSNMLVHYRDAYNRASRARQLAITEDGSTVFYPSGSAVQVYDVSTGRILTTLKGGHFEGIYACVWNPLSEELYTGSTDMHIVVWSPNTKSGQCGESDGDESDGDAWSD